jgi:exopolysaccharide biosynthesis WecB/TagA/CpsF family protein
MRTTDQLLNLLGRVQRQDNYPETAGMIEKRLAVASGPVVLSFVNAHAYNLCNTDPSFFEALNASDLLLRDGAGMLILFRALQADPGVNFCGTDFIPYLLHALGRKRVALLGTREPYLAQAAAWLRRQGTEIVLTMDGFREPEEYLEQVAATQPEVVLLGMGMPKQESVSLLLKRNLDFPMLAINGGACIDYLGGRVSRAPSWMRQNGMEWVYRLMLEPRRMFNRYLVGNFLFLARVVAMKNKTALFHSFAKQLEVYENSSDRIGRRALD